MALFLARCVRRFGGPMSAAGIDPALAILVACRWRAGSVGPAEPSRPRVGEVGRHGAGRLTAPAEAGANDSPIDDGGGIRQGSRRGPASACPTRDSQPRKVGSSCGVDSRTSGSDSGRQMPSGRPARWTSRAVEPRTPRGSRSSSRRTTSPSRVTVRSRRSAGSVGDDYGHCPSEIRSDQRLWSGPVRIRDPQSGPRATPGALPPRSGRPRLLRSLPADAQ